MQGELLPQLLSTSTWLTRPRIQNPLHGIPQDTLLSQVEEFVKEKGFDEYMEVFKKGALIAQNPSHYEELPLLDEADRQILRDEVIRTFPSCFFNQPLLTELPR